MTKRSTTGRPRKERDLEARRRYRSKSEKERRMQRGILIGAGVIAGIIVILVAYALINDLIIVPRQEISTVDGTEIITKDFQERVRAQRWYLANQAREVYEQSGQNISIVNQIASQLDDVETFGDIVLDDMELEVLLEEAAKEYDVTVDEAAIEAQVDDYLSSFTNLSLTPTATHTATMEATATSSPLITATPSPEPSATLRPTETPLPTAEGCEDEEDCPTVTPLPTATITLTPSETPIPSETPTPLPREQVEATVERFESQYFDDAEDTEGVERDAVRDIFYLVALRDTMRDAVTDQMIETGELRDFRLSTQTRHILIAVPGGAERQQEAQTGIPFDETLCESEEWAPYRQQALDIITRLNAGESFALLAQTVSADPGSATNGGVLPPVRDAHNSGYAEPFQQAVIDLEVGDLSEPVCTIFGYHIIQNIDKEITELSDFELRGMRDEAYQNWETDLVLSADIQRREDWVERVPDDPSVDDLLGDLIEEE